VKKIVPAVKLVTKPVIDSQSYLTRECKRHIRQLATRIGECTDRAASRQGLR
jgi:hypothetical protein